MHEVHVYFSAEKHFNKIYNLPSLTVVLYI